MTKESKKNFMGMAVYFCIATLFGGAVGLLALIIKEDNDRCHYYNGKYDEGDLLRGCAAVAVGMAVRVMCRGHI